jgi:hypothetical protein
LESISLFLALIYLWSKPQILQFFNLLQSISLFLALIYLQSKPQIQQFFNLLQSVSLPHTHITTIETSDPAILQPLAKASLSLPRNHTPKSNPTILQPLAKNLKSLNSSILNKEYNCSEVWRLKNSKTWEMMLREVEELQDLRVWIEVIVVDKLGLLMLSGEQLSVTRMAWWLNVAEWQHDVVESVCEHAWQQRGWGFFVERDTPCTFLSFSNHTSHPSHWSVNLLLIIM